MTTKTFFKKWVWGVGKKREEKKREEIKVKLF